MESASQGWRARAVSIAHALNITDRLGVGFRPQEIVGETFYAGIPPITEEELECARSA